MKNLTIILAVLITMAITVKAQIPNNGFENWTSVGNYENPDGWATMNSISLGSFYSCQKSADPYPVGVGNNAIKLTNNTSLTQLTGGWGMVITKAFDYPFKPAFPISGHPNSLTGYFKYVSLNSDSLMIKIILFNNGTIVANKDFYCGVTTINWTSFNIPINYTTADSATIWLSAFTPNGPTTGPKGNSSLKVDNLNFDNLITTGISDIEADNKFSVYPNPATDKLFIQSPKEKVLSYKIIDMQGKVFADEKLNLESISLNGISNGILVVQLNLSDGTTISKRVLKTE